jgi:Domain of unknown function (DUF4261)
MSHFITYLALERPAAVTAAETVAAFRRLAGSLPMEIEAVSPSRSLPGEALVLTVSHAPVTVMFIDQPLPRDAWEAAAAGSIVWPGAAAAMEGARAHVIVALLNDAKDHASALNGASAVTMVAGALAALLPVAAAVFTEARSIVKGGGITEMAARFAQGQVPDLLWTSMSFRPGAALRDGRPSTAAMTTGLAAFIGREIEFLPAPLTPAEIAQRLIGLCQYLIVNGLVIKDGETVGLTKDEKIRVRYTMRSTPPATPVLLMSLETADPAAPPPIAGPRSSGLSSAPRAAFGKRGL